MTTYDVTPDDEPLDVRAVTEDDQLVERLRHALSPEAAVVWDDDDDDDPGYALLRAIQRDVSADLPVGEPILPSGVTPLLPRRRMSRTATIAVVAAGVLSIGGVAAASAPGQPLAGVRHAVSDAVASAVDAITPDSPVGPTTVEPTHSPSAQPTPPGDAVSDAARSAAAVLQIEANLDRAAAFLADGRTEPAQQQLDAAARKLHYVTDAADHTRLADRLAALQAQLAAAPTAAPSHGPADKGKGKGKGGDAADSHGSSHGPVATHTPTPQPAKNNRTQRSIGVSTDKAKAASQLPGDNNGVGGRGNTDRG